MTTALAAQKIRHPHSTWILDDGDRPALRQLAAASRTGVRDPKRGMERDAPARESGESEQRPDANRGRVPAHSRRGSDPRTGHSGQDAGLLQQPPRSPSSRRPQYFSNVPADDPLGSQAPLFYGPIQQGKDGWNAAFFCGSNAILRREALMQLGLSGYVKETEKSIRRALSASRAAIRKARKAANRRILADQHTLDEVEAATEEARRRLDAGDSAQRNHVPGTTPGGPGRPGTGAGRCVRPSGRPEGNCRDGAGGASVTPECPW